MDCISEEEGWWGEGGSKGRKQENFSTPHPLLISGVEVRAIKTARGV